MTLRIDDDTIKARARLIPEKRFPHRLPALFVVDAPLWKGLGYDARTNYDGN